MSIKDELIALSAPRNVVDAGAIIDKNVSAGLMPQGWAVRYVQEWVTRNRSNNRYGL